MPINTKSPVTRFWRDAIAWVSRWTSRLRHRPATNRCPRCGVDLADKPRYRDFHLCDDCGYYFPFPVRARIRALVDPHSFVEFIPAQSPVSRSRWAFSRDVYRATRRRQSVLTGKAMISGEPVTLVAFDFSVTGGTMTVAAGERIARAFSVAQESSLPVLALIASGGVRIQEGIPALLQMARTVQAVNEFRQAHRLFVALLANPTTGGVYASFASLADILLAEPNTILGFVGPRVAQAITGSPIPPNSHNAQTALENGMLDAIVPRQTQRDLIARLLQSTAAFSRLAALTPPVVSLSSEHCPEKVLALARHLDRPTSLDYIPLLFTDFVELHGDRLMSDDPTIIGGLARFQNIPIMVIGQQHRRGNIKARGSTPAGYHKAERLIDLAGRLRLSIVTLIDTPGADPGYDSERFGIAGAIAHCLSAFMLAPSPTVAIVIGEATSGGALALAAADRVLMQENAIYPVISPEGASTILYDDPSRGSDTVGILGITVYDLLPHAIIDSTIAEPEGGAHTSVDQAAAHIKNALHIALADLLTQDDAARLAQRRHRYHTSREQRADRDK